MVCRCCGCDVDEDCPLVCNQIGNLLDPSGPQPDGWTFSNDTGYRNDIVQDCEDCNDTNYPTPDNITDYGRNCWQAPCCDNACYLDDEVCPP